MAKQVSKRKRHLAGEDEETVREDYVKKMRDTYPLIIRTLMHDLIVSFDKNGDIVFLNDAAVEFWGHPSELLIGTQFYDYLYPEDMKKAQVALQEIIKSKGQVKGLIIKVKSPKGARQVAWNAVAIFDENGEYVGIQATGKDLTDLMHAEEELKWSQGHFRRLFEVMVDPVVIVDKNGNILEISQSAEEVLGFPRGEIVGKHFTEIDVVADETKAVMLKQMEKMKNGEYISPYTIEAVARDGKKLLYELTPTLLTYKGEPAILAIFHNITEQRKAEKKLLESEERFDYFIQNAPEAIWVQDVNGIFLDGNKRAEKLTGYKTEELVGKNMLDVLVSPESITRLMEAFTPNKLGKISGPNELELIRKDGIAVPVEASIIPVERDGRIEIIGITRDITERKKAEEALKESEKRFREMSDLLPEIVFETDVTGKLTFVNQVAYERFGYTQEDFDKGLTTSQMLVPEERNRGRDEVDRVLSGANTGFTEHTALRKDGGTFPIMIHSTPIVRGNMPVGLRGIIIDITNQKKAENELRASEERFRSLIDNAPDAIWIQDAKGTVVDGNKQAEKITGYKREELIGKNILEVNLIPEKYVPTVLEALSTVKKGERSHETKLELRRKDGSLVSVETSAIPVERDGKVEVVGIARDVTERQKQEKLLRRARKKFETYFDLAKVMLIAIDAKGNVTQVNKKGCEVLGYKKEQILGKNWFDTFLPKRLEKETKAYFKQLLAGQIEPVEYNENHVLTKAGEERLIAWYNIQLRDEQGNIKGSLSSGQDITESKKAREELLQSEKRFRELSELLPEVVFEIDLDGFITYVNRSAFELFGFSEQDVENGLNLLGMLTPESQKKARKNFDLVLKGEKLGANEYVGVKKDGSTFPCLGHCAAIIKENEPVGIRGVIVDITERKKTEDALRRERGMLEMVTSNVDAGLAVISKDYQILWANDVLKSYMGNLEGVTCYSVLHKQNSVCSNCGVKEIFDTGKDLVFHEQKIDTPKGPIWLGITAAAIRNETGEIVAASEMSLDITERKKIENELKESLEKFRTIFEGATDGIAAINPETQKFVFVNPRMSEITGYPANELLKMNIANLFRKEDLQFFIAQFQKHFEKKTTITRDVPILRKDKEIVYCDGSSRVMKIGNRKYLVAFVRDVTEQKKAEKALKKSEQRFRAIFEGATDGILAADAKTLKFAFANPRMSEITGYSIDELLNLNITDLSRKEDLPVGMKQFEDQLKGKTTFTQNASLLRKDKEVIYCDVSSRFMNIGDNRYLVGFFRDVTERKRAEEELIRLSNAVKMSNDSIVISNLDGTIIDVNDESLKLHGTNDKRDLIGINSFNLIVPEEREEALDGMKKVLEKGHIKSQEYTVLTKDGKRIPVEMSTAIMKNADDKPIGFVTISRDITERKKAEDALRESEKKYHEMIDSMNDTALVLDFDTNIIDANQTAVDVLGYSREELLSMKVQKFDASLTPETIKGLAEKMETHGLLVFETTHTTKDGKTFPVEISATHVTYQGKSAILSIARDITERKRAEKALRSSERAARRLLEFQNKIIDTATVWVNLIDPKGNVILWNRAAELVSGYSRKEILGTNKMWELLYPDPDYRAKIFSIGKKITQEGKQIEDYYSTIRCKDGVLKTVSWYATNLLDEKGEPAGSVSIGIDVTEREKAQQEIKEANALLKQSNRDLESYTYVVSHDLKAPLRTIRSFGSFLLEDYEKKLDETGKDYLNRMINASSHLDSMIEDLLVLSRVGRKFTEVEKVDLNELLKEILIDLEATIKERNAQVVVDKLPTLYVHRVWKRQLFTNLISNALKFNESKTPKIEVLYEERENDHLFMVRDNGIGIEEKYLERIFNLFERAPTEKKYEGTGAGLAICKKIVEQLGGKIWVESTPGKGSTFFFTIPKKELKPTGET